MKNTTYDVFMSPAVSIYESPESMHSMRPSAVDTRNMSAKIQRPDTLIDTAIVRPENGPYFARALSLVKLFTSSEAWIIFEELKVIQINFCINSAIMHIWHPKMAQR